MVPATPPAVHRAGEQHLRLEDLGGCRLAQPQQGRRHQHGGQVGGHGDEQGFPRRSSTGRKGRRPVWRNAPAPGPTSSLARMTTPWFHQEKNRLICWMPLLSPQGVRKPLHRAVAEQHEEVSPGRASRIMVTKARSEPEKRTAPLSPPCLLGAGGSALSQNRDRTKGHRPHGCPRKGNMTWGPKVSYRKRPMVGVTAKAMELAAPNRPMASHHQVPQGRCPPPQ